LVKVLANVGKLCFADAAAVSARMRTLGKQIILKWVKSRAGEGQGKAKPNNVFIMHHMDEKLLGKIRMGCLCFSQPIPDPSVKIMAVILTNRFAAYFPVCRFS